MPGVRTLLILDAGDRVLAARREELVGRDFHQRDYFHAPARQADAALLYVSPPFRTSLSAMSTVCSLAW